MQVTSYVYLDRRLSCEQCREVLSTTAISLSWTTSVTYRRTASHWSLDIKSCVESIRIENIPAFLTSAAIVCWINTLMTSIALFAILYCYSVAKPTFTNNFNYINHTFHDMPPLSYLVLLKWHLLVTRNRSALLALRKQASFAMGLASLMSLYSLMAMFTGLHASFDKCIVTG